MKEGYKKKKQKNKATIFDTKQNDINLWLAKDPLK